MIILDVEQGSPEWHEARYGNPTASRFSDIITSTGKPSASADKYAYLLAGEKISGKSDIGYSSAYMERGIELEPEARSYYEFLTGNTVDQVGFIISEDRKYGGSPDGLIGIDGGIEIKCPSMAVHTKYLHGWKCPTEYYQQVQGYMLITGRQWWDFMSYHPDLKPLIVRCYPDLEFFKLLQKEIDKLIVKRDKIISDITR